MTTTTEYGKQNMFGKEVAPELIDAGSVSEQSELLNGRLAMIGFVAGIGAYVTTGQIIPGIF
tara:strand:+ start:295 stop:480 length:186 start_codon:yes stop_codon:yes gene_type:complete